MRGSFDVCGVKSKSHAQTAVDSCKLAGATFMKMEKKGEKYSITLQNVTSMEYGSLPVEARRERNSSRSEEIANALNTRTQKHEAMSLRGINI